ncbi:hypothetical protein X975_00677, partial [Stegodyphus mimosarum]
MLITFLSLYFYRVNFLEYFGANHHINCKISLHTLLKRTQHNFSSIFCQHSRLPRRKR